MQETRISPRRKRSVASFAFAVVSLAAVACSDSSSAPAGGTGDSTGTRVVASVSVTPTQRSLIVGDTLTLSARASDPADLPIDGRPVAWMSTNDDVAIVTTTGTVFATGPGSVTIRATIDGKSGEASFTVTSPATPQPVARVELSPSNLSLGLGSSGALVARAFDASGHELFGRPTIWASRDTLIAVVDSSGKVLAKSVGTTLVSAMVDGHLAEAPASISVLPAAVASISVTPVGFVLDIGQTRQLTAIVLDANGNRLTDRVVTWSSDSPDVATVSSTGVVSAVGYGYATVTATSEGKTFSLAVTVSYGY